MTDPSALRDALPAQAPRGRLPITLVLDSSQSMEASGRIDELNAALQSWRTELLGNDHLASIGEVALVSFGFNYVQVLDASGRVNGRPEQPYVAVRDFRPPVLRAAGVTPMVAALQTALDLVAARRLQLRDSGTPLKNRPLIYLITDGVPTDDQGMPSDSWRDFAPVLREQEKGRQILFFALGVSGADMDVLRELAPSSAYDLADLPLAQVLNFVSTSTERLSSASREQPAEDQYRGVRDQQERSDRIREWLEKNV